jgi:hypothetical protein
MPTAAAAAWSSIRHQQPLGRGEIRRRRKELVHANTSWFCCRKIEDVWIQDLYICRERGQGVDVLESKVMPAWIELKIKKRRGLDKQKGN